MWVDHLELQRWTSELSTTQSGAFRREIVGVMSAILDLALRDKRIAAIRVTVSSFPGLTTNAAGI